MEYSKFIEEQKAKYEQIVEVIGDNLEEVRDDFVEDNLGSINHDFYLIQKCNDQIKRYTHLGPVQRKLNSLFNDLRAGKKIQLRG